MNKYRFIFIIICLDFFLLGNVSPLFSQFSRILIFLVLFLSDIHNREKIGQSLILTFGLLIISLLSLQDSLILEISSFMYMYILLNLSQKKSTLVISDRVLSKLFLLFILSFYIQLIYINFETGNYAFLREDRNHSGTILLFFTILLVKFKKYKYIFLVIPMFILLMSRTVVFSLLIFLILYNFKVFYNYKKLITLLSISSIVLLPLIVNYIFITYLGDTPIGSENNLSRFINLKDGSNVLRFKITGEQLSILFNNFSDFIFNSQSINNLTRDVFKSEMPHSSVVEFIYRFGFLRFSIFLFICFRLIKSRFSFAMFISIMFAGAIIHNVYTLNLFFLFLIINSNYESKFQRVNCMIQK
tara:strand:- start:5853 stop:6926 length:1074 start_codon:yes stop_codon:yes gene_type:complete